MQVHTDLNHLPAFSKTVVTIGSYDGVHTGHRKILSRVVNLARACGGESVVLTFEPHPRTVLQPEDRDFRLITTTREKIRLLGECGIDHVVLVPFSMEFARQSAQTYVEEFLVRHFHPCQIVIGYDHRFGANREGDIAFLRRYESLHRFEVVEIPVQEVDAISVSSSKIRKALLAAEIRKANRLLGSPYAFRGKVVRGNQIGRQIGFPTANLEIDQPLKLIPPPGIYAATASVDGATYDAMLYIGSRPTVGDALQQRIEVNLLDFEGDLYDRFLEIQVLDFIRGDARFDDLAALQQGIIADRSAIRASLARLKAQQHAIPPEQVAIVILNYNTRRHLETFLPSVIEHSPGVRVVVADNGSPDDSIAFLREHYPEVAVLDLGSNFGFAQGYNEALKQVDAAVYVVLNSDVEVSAGWLEPVLEAMASDPLMAVAQPKILSWQEKDRFEYAGAAGGWIDRLGYPFCRGRVFQQLEVDQGQYDQPTQCFWAAGAAFFIRAELYHQMGGFDGAYFAHNEEIDLCWRLKRAGYSVWCIPASVVYHLGGGTLEYDRPRKVFLNFRNSLFTLFKNEPGLSLLWLLPLRLVLDGLAAVLFLWQRKPAAVGAILQAHFSFYGNIRFLLRRRRETALLVERHRGAPGLNRAGVYQGSIVWQYYARRIKTFSRLMGKNHQAS